VVAFVPSPAPGHRVAYPTGPGQSVRLDFSPLENIGSVAFLPDGRLFFCGAEPGKPRRCYRRELRGATPEPITPEGIATARPSPDGRSILTTTGGVWQVLDLQGGSPKVVPGDHAADRIAGWSSDGRAVYVTRGLAVPALVERIDLATGARSPVRELMPPDRLGIIQVRPSRIFDAGKTYAYGYWRQTTKGVIVRGVRMQ
jgi:hypothetical protein